MRLRSVTEISGDVPLTSTEKLRYFFFNLFRNIGGIRMPPRTRFWWMLHGDASAASVGRSYMDAFLREEVPKLLPKKDIRILDIGCGRCHARDAFASVGVSGTYLGIDVVKEPGLDMTSPSMLKGEFLQGDFLTQQISGPFDLIFSNTALEHIADDFRVLKKTQRLLADDGIEIHVIPSHWTLLLYLWHGYRQYSPGRIKKICGDRTHAIYRLGGAASFLAHFFFTTLPERIIGGLYVRDKKLYRIVKRTANHLDRIFRFFPIAYAIVLHK